MPPSYQLIASDQSWIEGEALRQLEQTAPEPPARARPTGESLR